MMVSKIRTSILIALAFFIIGTQAHAQTSLFLETDYIFPSSFKNVDQEKGGRGDAKVIQGGVQFPISVKQDEEKGLRAWSLSVGGTYTRLDNQGLSEDMVLSEILNGQIGLNHRRSLNEKWSLMGTVGAGVFLDSNDLSEARFENMLLQGGVVFIRHLRPNLDIGGGISLNNLMGYPMVFPALYLDWSLDREYHVSVSVMDEFEVLAGKQMNENLALNLTFEVKGALALLEQAGTDMMFTHNYITGGIQPKFTINESLTIPVTLGLSFRRAAMYNKRTLRGVFNEDYEPHFMASPYISASIMYGF